MTVPMLIMIAAAGGVGAALRFLVDSAILRRQADPAAAFPRGTWAVNLGGSLLLGLITGWAGGHAGQGWVTVAGVGLLGGYTTFSTASVETVRLLADHRVRAGLLNGLGLVLGSIVVAYGGLVLGRLA